MTLDAPIAFVEFPKIGRLSRDMVVTEKIDGTNGVIHISDAGDFLVGSRSQWITPEKDNHGFARWAMEHRAELMQLGPGTHYGEWWGAGIQRRYGLTEKRFSLFNVGRWVDSHTGGVGDLRGKQEVAPQCCHVVPTLMLWTFDTAKIDDAIADLQAHGSYAAPGFMQPEGVVVFHTANSTLFKKTIEKDDEWKGQRA